MCLSGSFTSGSYGLGTMDKEWVMWESDLFLTCMVGREVSDDSSERERLNELKRKHKTST